MNALGRMGAVFVIAAGWVLGTPGAASAQEGDVTITELRRENARLRERVAELEATVAAREASIASLERAMIELRREIASLQAALQGVGTGTAPTTAPPPTTVAEPEFAELPTDRFGAPEAMLAFTVESFNEAFGAAVPDFGPEGEDATARRLHMQELKRWARRVTRQEASPVEWTIEVVRLDELDRDGELQFRVVHPGSKLPYSDRVFLASIEGAMYRSLMREDEPLSEGVWILEGRARITPEIEPALEQPLAFDVPPFVGPYVEFGFDLDVQRMRRPVDEEPADDSDAAGS